MSSQLILNVVRGIDHWTVLKKFGVSYYDHGWHTYPYKNPTSININDVIMGFKNHSKDKVALQEWASFMICASDNFIDFDVFENNLEGDKFIDALWDAAFGEDITSFILSL